MKLVENKLIKGCILFLITYFIAILLFYVIADEQLYFRDARNPVKTVEGNSATEEIIEGAVVEQTFISEIDYIDGFTVRLATFARNNVGDVTVSLIDESKNGEILIEKKLDISTLQDSVFTQILPESPVSGRRGHILKIRISSENCTVGNAISPWYRSGETVENWRLTYNGRDIDGVLCFDTIGRDIVWTGSHYWQIMAGLGLLLALYCLWVIYRNRQGRLTILTYVVGVLIQYKFLFKQLVARDFKVKYKRSFLGMLWSFLNPLLTMSVQYMVFSTVFKSDIQYYPVYLLSGIVLFNFFQESTNQALYSIVGNASLITKVYVPKYIYPISKVLSSTINLLISLLPLLLMILIMGVPIKVSYVLIIYILIVLLIFNIGVGFILSSLMVFFRDIQFIWSVFSLLWMYATPIFYPESIFPDQFKAVLKLNPLYYFIKFARTIFLEGISPEPMMYVQCMGFAVAVLLIGIVIFKKTQDKFALYV